MTRTSTCFALRRWSFAEWGNFSSFAEESRKFVSEKSRSYEMTRRLTIREGFSDTCPLKKNFNFANRLWPKLLSKTAKRRYFSATVRPRAAISRCSMRRFRYSVLIAG
jgi:hypothetical protein